MTGADMLLWIAIGVVGGWGTAVLVAGRGGNASRGTAAGLIGALLGGFGARGLPQSGGGHLSELVAALAGSLLLGVTVSVATSRRRRGTGRLERGDDAGEDAVRVAVASGRGNTSQGDTSQGHSQLGRRHA
jgi:hypothetical protein